MGYDVIFLKRILKDALIPKISSELQFPMEIRDQSLIVSHTNPSKFVLVPSVWNQFKIREIYMGQYQTFILYILAGNYN